MTIASGVIPGDEVADPDDYRLYQRRDRAEEVVGDLEAFRDLVAQRGNAARSTSVSS